MKGKIVEYWVTLSTYNKYDGRNWKLVAKSKDPIIFNDINKIRNSDVVSLLFWHKELNNDDSNCNYGFEEFLDKKYIIGTVCNFNDIPKTADFNYLVYYNQKTFSEQNIKCILSRQNQVYMVERCGNYLPEECSTQVINPSDLSNIKEINVNGIEFLAKEKE